MKSRSMDPFTVKQLPPSSAPPQRPPAPAAPVRGTRSGNLLGFIDHLQMDDYILIGIIAVLFFEGCDDYILMAALGYLFIMGIL